MKWLTMLAAVAMAIPVSVSVPSVAAAQALPSSGLVDDCKANRPPERTIGECVSTQTVRALGVPGTAPLQCDFLREVFPDFFDANWSSYEECVQDISAQLRSTETQP